MPKSKKSKGKGKRPKVSDDMALLIMDSEGKELDTSLVRGPDIEEFTLNPMTDNIAVPVLVPASRISDAASLGVESQLSSTKVGGIASETTSTSNMDPEEENKKGSSFRDLLLERGHSEQFADAVPESWAEIYESVFKQIFSNVEGLRSVGVTDLIEQAVYNNFIECTSKNGVSFSNALIEDGMRKMKGDRPRKSQYQTGDDDNSVYWSEVKVQYHGIGMSSNLIGVACLIDLKRRDKAPEYLKRYISVGFSTDVYNTLMNKVTNDLPFQSLNISRKTDVPDEGSTYVPMECLSENGIDCILAGKGKQMNCQAIASKSPGVYKAVAFLRMSVTATQPKGKKSELIHWGSVSANLKLKIIECVLIKKDEDLQGTDRIYKGSSTGNRFAKFSVYNSKKGKAKPQA